jgi:tetratricopeptide (TPR) repeat protein
MENNKKSRLETVLRKIGRILFAVIVGTLAILLIVGVCYFIRFTNLFSNFKWQQEIMTFMGQNQNSKIPDCVITTTLSNTTFVVQFVAWITALGAIILAIFTFFGIKEWINFQGLKQQLETEYNNYKKRFDNIEVNSKFILEFSQAKIFYTQSLTDESFLSECWEILSKLPEINYEVVLYKGLTQLKRKDYFDAITSFEKALKFKDADLARIYFNIGRVWFEKKEYRKSIEYFDKAISDRSNYSPAYNQKALALRRLGKLDEALKTLSIILHLDEKDAQALYNSACYQALLKNKDEALEYLGKAIGLNSKRYLGLAAKDPDFEIYKIDEGFKKLISPKSV